MARDIELGIGFDTTDADRENKELQDGINKLDGKKINVEVVTDTTSAQRAVDGLRDKTVKVTIEEERKSTSTRPTNADGESKVEATREGLIRAAQDLYLKSGEKGTEEGARIQQKIADFIAGLKSMRELSQTTIEGLAHGFETLIDDANRLSPNALNRLAKDIQKVGNDYQDFVKAVEDETGIEFKVAIDGIDKLDALNKKIEVISNAKGLDDGIKELENALVHLDAKKADDVRKTIERIKSLMTQELNADTINQMNEAFKDLRKTAEGFNVRETMSFAPALQTAQDSMEGLRDSVGAFGAVARREFDISSMSTSLLAGDVEGLARGFIGLAAGARTTGTAIKAAFATTVIGAVVAAIGWAVSKTIDWIKYIVELKEASREVRIDGYTKDLEEANEAHDRVLKKIEEERQKINDTVEIYKSQQEAILGTVNAYNELAKARDLANAGTERERSAISTQYETKKRVDETTTALNIANKEMEGLRQKRVQDNEEIKSLEETLKQAQSTRDSQKEEMDELIRKAEKHGGLVERDQTGAIKKIWNLDQVQEHLRGDANYNIPEQEIERWKRNIVKRVEDSLLYTEAQKEKARSGDVRTVLEMSNYIEAKRNNIPWAHDDEYYLEKVQKPSDQYKNAYNQAYNQEIELQNKRRQVAEKLKTEIENKAKEISRLIDQQTEAMLSPFHSAKIAVTDFENEDILKRREERYTRLETYGLDREKLAVLQARQAESARFAQAYKSGGVDEYGKVIEMGIDEAKKAQTEYAESVRLAAAVMKAKSGVNLNDEEQKLINSQKLLKTALDKQAQGAKLSEKETKAIADASTVHKDVAAKAQKAASVMPTLLNGYRQHLDATRQLTEQMNSLAVTYRDQARAMRLAQEEREWTREDAEWQRTFNKASEADQRRMLQERESENSREVAQLENQLRNDAANKARFAELQRRRSEGATLTAEESAFLSNPPKFLNEQELEIINRDLNWAQQFAEQSKQQLADMRLARTLEDEQRAYDYAKEDEEFERDKILKRSGIYGKAALEKQRLDESQASFDEANSLLEYTRHGTQVRLTEAQRRRYEETYGKRENETDEAYARRKIEDLATIRAGQMLAAARGEQVNLTKLQETQLTRQRDEMRGRITTSRGQIDDLRLQQEERRAEFNEGIFKQSNRLTAMGLGGDAVGWNKETASNTRELVLLAKEQIKEFQNFGRKASETRRVGHVTWAMR